MEKEGLWLVIQSELGHHSLVLVEGKYRVGLLAMEVYEWVAGRHIYAVGEAYGSCRTLVPVNTIIKKG